MNLLRRATLVSLCGLLISAYASADPVSQKYDPEILMQVEAIYGLSEQAAIARLGKEYDAMVQARHIEERQLPSFAGMWFDSATQTLHVAVSDEADFESIQRVGATPVLVEHSLAKLESVRQSTADMLVSNVGPGSVRESYVDIQTNAVVFGISKDAMPLVSSSIATRADVNVPVRLKEVVEKVGFSTSLLGAVGTEDHTWDLAYGGAHPCSTGASAEKVSGTSYVVGFATAGHCNQTANVIWTSTGTDLGRVDWSTYTSTFTFANEEDGAWAHTVAGWVPQPQVQGYTNGILNVSGTWSGLLVASVGITACRYGEASGGPHCAPISAHNVRACLRYCDNDPNNAPVYISGLTKINNICTNDGDSGGAVITPANQIQGTVTGGTTNSCPDSSGDYVYYQPIATTLTRGGSALHASLAMLTTHGRSAPTLNQFRCPDPSNSGTSNGFHIYTCNFSDYDSQGITSISWTTSTGLSSDTEEVSGTCPVPGPMVNVVLAVTNPYGTTSRNLSFACPTYPLP